MSISSSAPPSPTSAFSIMGKPRAGVSGIVAIWESSALNIGDDYDNTTGKYCPEYNGIYILQLHLYKKSLGIGVHCAMTKESASSGEITQLGMADVPSETTQDGNYGGSTAAIVHLEQGDCVFVSNCYLFDNIGYITTFSGGLLHLDP